MAIKQHPFAHSFLNSNLKKYLDTCLLSCTVVPGLPCPWTLQLRLSDNIFGQWNMTEVMSANSIQAL